MKTKKIISSLVIFMIALNVSFAQSPNFGAVIAKKESIIKLNNSTITKDNTRIEIYTGIGAAMFDVYPAMDTAKKTSLVIHWGVEKPKEEIYFYRRGETAFWMVNDQVNGYYVTCNNPRKDQDFIILDKKTCVALSPEEIIEFNTMVDLFIATTDEVINSQNKKN